MKQKSTIFMSGLIALLFLLASCATENKTKKDAVRGVPAGVTISQDSDGDTEGTLLGAAIGAAIGTAPKAETDGSIGADSKIDTGAASDTDPEIETEGSIDTDSKIDTGMLSDTDPEIEKDDTTPPEITILEPQNQRGIIRRKGDKIIVKGNAIDQSGIQKVLINGVKASLQKDGYFQALAQLKVGNNSIIVQATDIHNNTAIETITVRQDPSIPIVPPPKITTSNNPEGWYSQQYAIVIGIDFYQNPNIPRLRNAINDAKAIAKMFREKMEFAVTELYGKDATRGRIIKAIGDIRQKAKKQDGLIFYFAGHGQGIQLENKELEGYIIPYDADLDIDSVGAILFDEEAISLNRLRTYAQDFKAQHIALILDSCFSGLAMKRSYPRFPPMTIDYYNDLLARKAINILTAGDDHPVSDGTGHSPFTQALLNALDHGNIDLHDRDGFATFNQLAVYVKEKVEKATGRRQRPQFDNLSMDDGEFVFRVVR